MKLKKFLVVLLATWLAAGSLAAHADFTKVDTYAKTAVDAFTTQGVLTESSLEAIASAKRSDVIMWLMLSMKVEAVQKETPTYKDVPKTLKSYGYIEAATDMGIIKGDTDAEGNLLFTFRPDSQINRAEVAKILVLANKIDLYSPEKASFKDAVGTEWYFPYVEAAFKAGIIKGFSNTDGTPTWEFGPAKAVINQDAVLMMHRSQTELEVDVGDDDMIDDDSDDDDMADDDDDVADDDSDVADDDDDVADDDDDVADDDDDVADDDGSSQVPAGWTEISGKANLASVSKLYLPEEASFDDKGLLGDTSYTLNFETGQTITFEDKEDGLDEIDVLEDTLDGMTPAELAMASYEAVKAQVLAHVPGTNNCTTLEISAATTGTVEGEKDFATVDYTTTCTQLGISTVREYSYAVVDVGGDKGVLFFVIGGVNLGEVKVNKELVNKIFTTIDFK